MSFGKEKNKYWVGVLYPENMIDEWENLKQLFGCDVDLVRFRDSLRPMFKNNIQNEAIYV